jgi:hypothetical protein
VISVVDLDDPVHAFEIDDDRARQRGRCAAVSQIPSRRHRPQGNPVGVGGPDDRLHLLDALRRDRCRRHPVFGFVPERRVGVAVEREVVVVREDPLPADGCGEFVERLGEVTSSDAGRCRHGPPPQVLSGRKAGSVSLQRFDRLAER